MVAPCLPSPVQTVDVGDVQLTFLPDGEVHFEPTVMFPQSAERPEAWEAHIRWLDGDGRYVATVGAFLVRVGDRKVLIDAGLGVMEMDIEVATVSCGRLLDNLVAAGVTPAEIDTVVYSHLHSDHAGWTSADGKLSFPNAEHVIGSEAEFTYWRENPEAAFAPSQETVLDPLEPRLSIASDGQVVAPGVTLVATPGHTPGHQTVVVSSGDERAIIMGDLLHCPVQLVEPEWSVMFDVDTAMARRTREKLLDELVAEDVTIACGHFPETAFGRILKGEGKRYWHA